MKPNRAIVLSLIFAAATIAAHSSLAQPKAEEALAATELSDAEQQRVLAGELVGGDLKAVSERDLSLSLAFIVKTSPAELAKQVLAGTLSKSDDQLTARGDIKTGTMQDFAGAKLVPGGKQVAQAYIDATPGDKLNLSTEEIAAFNALKGQGDPTQAAEQQLRSMLLARYQAYRQSGLAGIRPYDRGGKNSDGAADLRKASEASLLLKKYFPIVHGVLVGYPQASAAGMSESFFWVNNKIDDQPTYALTHMIVAPEGDARVVVQRQFYAGRSYNVEQAVAAFLPVQQGTLVIYGNHTFTDQVSGFGGSAKQSIGRRVMGGKLKELFEKARAAAAKP